MVSTVFDRLEGFRIPDKRLKSRMNGPKHVI
jgi:hypothetical protein